MSSIDNINNKRPYVAPTVTAVVFRTERGYASSGDWVSHAANNLNVQIGREFPDMGFWAAQTDQHIYGTNTGAEGDDNLAAGEFYFYNTNADDGGWF